MPNGKNQSGIPEFHSGRIKKQKRRKRCTLCHELKSDVRKRVNPYEEDLNGIVVLVVVCDSCDKDLADEL